MIAPSRSGALLALALLVCVGCGEESSGGQRGPGGGRGPGGRPGSQGDSASAVPVEVATVERRSISSFIETNGVLEAENEVDLVARTAAPIIELLAEEGMQVRRGQLLVRLEQEELQAQVEIARVTLDEAMLVYERAKRLHAEELISVEEYESARADFESAQAQLAASKIQLGYTNITAPFGGWVIRRYVDFAEQVSVNTPLFRLSDFDPLLCPIQVPERELPKLKLGQRAYLTLEPWPGERFEAEVLLLSPVVDSATGTVKVTLKVRAEGKLRPGMFARVFLETATRSEALVIPKSALSLESIGDTVYVADGGTAARREVELGFREGDFVEVVSGVAAGDRVVVVGQDGLSDGTPIQVLGGSLVDAASAASRSEPGAAPAEGPRRPGEGRGRGGRPDFSEMNPEQLARAKEFMRARGMTDEQIAARIAGEEAPSKTEDR